MNTLLGQTRRLSLIKESLLLPAILSARIEWVFLLIRIMQLTASSWQLASFRLEYECRSTPTRSHLVMQLSHLSGVAVPHRATAWC